MFFGSLVFFLVESCQENYFSSFASFLLASFLSEPTAHQKEQLSFTGALVQHWGGATTLLGVNVVLGALAAQRSTDH